MAFNLPACDAFLNCGPIRSSSKALEWSELSNKATGALMLTIQFLDTRANLLYKLGRTEEAH